MKELADNGFDAAEAAGITPDLTIEVYYHSDRLVLSVCDNGQGIRPETVRSTLNFLSRTSDKTAYRAPLRGMQGNGLKTILGIPQALGIEESVIIEAQGIRHAIRAWIDLAGDLQINHSTENRPTRAGTTISLTLPTLGQNFTPSRWARALSLFNPHAVVKIREIRDGSKPC